MTPEDLQYQFETQEPWALMRLPTEVVVAYGRHVIRQIPAHEWVSKDWATTGGIIAQFTHTRDITAKQKWFLIRVIQETVPRGLRYL